MPLFGQLFIGEPLPIDGYGHCTCEAPRGWGDVLVLDWVSESVIMTLSACFDVFVCVNMVCVFRYVTLDPTKPGFGVERNPDVPLERPYTHSTPVAAAVAAATSAAAMAPATGAAK